VLLFAQKPQNRLNNAPAHTHTHTHEAQNQYKHKQ